MKKVYDAPDPLIVGHLKNFLETYGVDCVIKDIYCEIFPLVGPGGCFLNFDRTAVAVAEQTEWLREIGFKDVSCLWQGKGRALFGGFR